MTSPKSPVFEQTWFVFSDREHPPLSVKGIAIQDGEDLQIETPGGEVVAFFPQGAWIAAVAETRWLNK